MWNPLYNHEPLPEKCANYILAWECVLKIALEPMKLSQDILHLCHQTTMRLPSQNMQILYTTRKIVL